MSNPKWIENGTGATAKFRGVAMSPQGEPQVDDAFATILRVRDAGLQASAVDVPRHAKPAGEEGMEHIMLEPIAPSIGTVIHGVDCANLSDEEVGLIRRVWLQRKVVFFRNQGHLTDADFDRLSRRFGVIGGTHGELENEPSATLTGSVLKGLMSPGPYPHLIHINSKAGIEDYEAVPGAAGAWHSEVSWARRPPMATMLLAREVPPVGGDTMFCDAYAMYEGLPPAVKERCQGLTALHVGAPHHGVWTCEHPVLRTHPETGGTTLNVSPGFTRSIVGLDPDDSDKLLQKLQAQAGAPEYTCRFRWENGSLAFYDNRSCQHCAVAVRKTAARIVVSDQFVIRLAG